VAYGEHPAAQQRLAEPLGGRNAADREGERQER